MEKNVENAKHEHESQLTAHCRHRCEGCCYLAEGDNGEWLCTDFDYGDGVEIEKIADEDCSLNIPCFGDDDEQ